MRATSPVLSECKLQLSLDEGNSDMSITTNKKLPHINFVYVPCPEEEELEAKVKVEVVIKEEKVDAVEQLCTSEECGDVENTRLSLRDVRLPRLSDSQVS